MRTQSHDHQISTKIETIPMPIIYPVEQMPVQYHALFEWNPFYYFLNLFKVLMYEGRTPSFDQWAITSLIASACLLLGTYVIKQKERDIIYRL